jgi:hypothetical protein
MDASIANNQAAKRAYFENSMNERVAGSRLTVDRTTANSLLGRLDSTKRRPRLRLIAGHPGGVREAAGLPPGKGVGPCPSGRRRSRLDVTGSV